jgi:Tfp pilus assembly protein FimT
VVRKIRGYTTLELLILIAILAILSAIFIREYLIYTARERLKGAANEIASQLNWIKTKSMISTNFYGICYDNNTRQFLIIEEKNGIINYTNGTDLKEKWKGIEVVEITNKLLCPQAFFFDRRGELISGGDSGSIVLINAFGEKIKISISILGRISVQYGS